MEQGRRAKLDIEERRHFAQMLRGYRATLAMELRTFNESVIDRRAHMEGAIAEALAMRQGCGQYPGWQDRPPARDVRGSGP